MTKLRNMVEQLKRYDTDRSRECNFRENPRGDFLSYYDVIRLVDDLERGAVEPRASHGDGILDELEARGDDISKRAARYIRCKLAMLGDHPNRETT